nr:metal dependent phosphohydrolase [Marseillevirus cajuinensis]
MEKAVAVAKEVMSRQDVTHDWLHIKRVLMYARSIMLCTPEVSFDTEVVEIGCVLHDIADHKYSSCVNVEEVLNSLCLEDARKNKVREIIFRTSWSVQRTENDEELSNELRVVRDADKLDAICEEGVLRAFGVAAIRKSPMFVKDTPMYETWKGKGKRMLREDGSLVGHFYAKLFHLHRFLYFETSRKLAKPHHKKLKEFVTRNELFRG